MFAISMLLLFIGISQARQCLPEHWVPESELSFEEYDSQCLRDLVLNQYHQQAYQMAQLSENPESSLSQIIDASLEATQNLETLKLKLENQNKNRKKVVEQIPSIHWYQTLTNIEIKLVYAIRHDLTGCSQIEDELINITDTQFEVSAFCVQDKDQTLSYSISFPFWAEVDSSKFKLQRQPVGIVKFSIPKKSNPARWKTLVDRPVAHGDEQTKLAFHETEQKMFKIKLDLGKHSELFTTLKSFEGDQVTDFDGHDIYEVLDEKDPHDMTWLFPDQGPGKFKNLKKKKKTVKKFKKHYD